MSTLVRDVVYAGAGLKRLFMFQEGWRGCFDVSSGGVARSFQAALLAIPLYLLINGGLTHMAADLGAPRADDPVLPQVLNYARTWLVFPFVAAGAAIFFARKADYGTWLVVHNWAVLGLFTLQAIVMVLYLSGVLPIGIAVGFLVGPYMVIRLAVHWRVATATLRLSWGAGAAAATLHIVVDLLAVTVISLAFAASQA